MGGLWTHVLDQASEKRFDEYCFKSSLKRLWLGCLLSMLAVFFPILGMVIRPSSPTHDSYDVTIATAGSIILACIVLFFCETRGYFGRTRLNTSRVLFIFLSSMTAFLFMVSEVQGNFIKSVSSLSVCGAPSDVGECATQLHIFGKLDITQASSGASLILEVWAGNLFTDCPFL